MFKLNGKNVLITGATGGIGKAISLSVKEAGGTPIISGTNQEKLQALATELGGDINYIQANLSNNDELEQLYEKAESYYENGVDILICNAGITRDNLALRMKDEEWNEVLQLNLTAIFKLNQMALKKMSRKKYGRIINVASIVGFTGNFGQVNYVAAKAGLVGMTKTLALEAATRNITVNAIAPGFIETPMTEGLSENIKADVMRKIPCNRMGTPADIAHAAIYLASDEAAYVTGTTLHVNGGMYMA